MEQKDYKTLLSPTKEVLYKDKGSKFFGYVFPVSSEKEVQLCLEKLKEEHQKAGHFCYAWQIGKYYNHYKVNDDGEPNNSAGMPIYGQLQAFDVTNCLAVVVRYFGGTKLGVGGLIHAYKTTAKLCLEEANIIKKEITDQLEVKCNYEQMNEVLKLVKREDLSIVEQELKLKCRYILEVNVERSSSIKERLELLKGIAVREL